MSELANFTTTDRELTAGPLERYLAEAVEVQGLQVSPVYPNCPDITRLTSSKVPPGIIASTAAYDQGRLASVYPEPESWQPRRWLDATDEMHLNWTPFGHGARACPGSNLAMTELGVRPCVAYLKTPAPSPLNTNPDAARDILPKLDAKEVAALFTAPFHNFLREKDEDPAQREIEGEWYKGSWHSWHESAWRMHNFSVPVNSSTAFLAKASSEEPLKLNVDSRNWAEIYDCNVLQRPDSIL